MACLIAIAAQPFVPAEAGAMPAVVEREALMEANAVSSLTMVGAIVVAFTLGEPLIQGLGVTTAACVVAGAFGLSVVWLRRVTFLRPLEPAPRTGWWRELREGLSHIRQRGGIRRTMAFQVTIFSTFAALSVLAIVFAMQVLQTNFSWLLAAGGLGLGLGAWMIGRFGTRWPRDTAIAVGFFMTGLALWGLSFAGPGQLPLAFGLTFVAGFTASVVGVPLQTRLQERVEDAFRGKVFGVQNTVLNLVAIVPLGGTGFLLEWVGVPTVLLALAGVMVLAAVAAWWGRLEAVGN
jgi:predicted MFS family arabinose efflux permease